MQKLLKLIRKRSMIQAAPGKQSMEKNAEIIIKDQQMVKDRNSSQQIAPDVVTNKEQTELLCNIMGRSEFCEMKGDIRIDGNSSTASSVSSENILAAENTSWSIRPYARKEAPGGKGFR
ncbi:hypothetical protein SADUNF_Sadunf12G0037900 [Salix dunnii]|uniref:Uncharacterized protein n=1 Tax=Salix dunnii TaxID=1413687 RepID=A0A835MVR4_9ROSI|nr:hypothetical protein SADUNF_Sadunf12G0037900 [Salix dunnii]